MRGIRDITYSVARASIETGIFGDTTLELHKSFHNTCEEDIP